ncbi:hypothetical protein OBV_05920 [Oscillibacter valericigenes Sjm18-20]|nr:hypothetical protein OBV_05920 [Oscillibacter valericigenes Sjm18-20]
MGLNPKRRFVYRLKFGTSPEYNVFRTLGEMTTSLETRTAAEPLRKRELIFQSGSDISYCLT